MSTRKPFAKHIVLLGALPITIAMIGITIGFTFIQYNQLKQTRLQIIRLFENTVANSSEISVPHLALKNLEPLLNIEPIIHLSVVAADGVVVAERGLPISKLELSKIERNKEKETQYQFDTTTLIAIPVLTPAETYWIVGAVKDRSLFLSMYEGHLLILFLAMCSIGTTLIFSQRLYQAIAMPLNNILNDLRNALSNEGVDELFIPSDSPYADLIETLNEMISRQHSTKDEMQSYVDQSTKELRETLETVEIQNIELDIARKNALQASRAKSEFLANTSHELRTPLNGILGFTSLLLKTGLSNQQKDYLSTIEQSAHGLLTVINDILDFSKLETGQLTLECKPILVRELVEEVFSIFAPQAHEKNIRLLSIINHNLPRNLLGDPQRLKQVITNLVSNAIKFSARGNIVVKANAIGEMDSQVEVKFSISDNGIGLTEEQQEGLFTAFTKVDTSDSRFQGGTGLGLAIAKGLVDRMHGEIGVESEARSGSTFWFTVRLGVDRQRISQSPLMNSLYGVNALVYDANPSGRVEITHLLSSWGINFIEESDFSVLHSIFNLNHDSNIDLAILDAYTEENNFDKQKLVSGIQRITNSYRAPIILLAPPAIQRVLQDDIVGLNTIVVSRPIAHAQLHQSICNLLSIAEPLTASNLPLKAPRHQQKNRGIRILVVDDNASNRKLVSEFLKPLGVESICVESGYEALEKLKHTTFDLVLMDVQMPGMDGLETTKLMRTKEIGNRVPVVALTAHAVNEQKTKLLLSGMDDFLSKPVSEEDLISIIERWVTKSSSSNDELGLPMTTPSTSVLPLTTQKHETFNWAESMQLAKQKTDLATDMLKMLIESLDATQTALQQALEADNMQELLEVNHKFHGGCCYCGVPALRSASKALEQALHYKEYDRCANLCNKVLEEIHALRLWAEDHDIDSLFGEIDD